MRLSVCYDYESVQRVGVRPRLLGQDFVPAVSQAVPTPVTPWPVASLLLLLSAGRLKSVARYTVAPMLARFVRIAEQLAGRFPCTLWAAMTRAERFPHAL